MSTLRSTPHRNAQSRPAPLSPGGEKKRFWNRLSPRSLKPMLMLATGGSPIPMSPSMAAPSLSMSARTSSSLLLRSSPRIASRNSNVTSKKESSALMHWVQTSCPQDLVPKILAFAGPQAMASLSRTNQFWREWTDRESTWRVVSEELYKWQVGDPMPHSWKDFYMMNPCVPVDYSTIGKALKGVKASPYKAGRRTVRVMIRPGRYILREAIDVQAPDRVELVTMNMPDFFQPTTVDSSTERETNDSSNSPRKRGLLSPRRLRQRMSCRAIDVEEQQQAHRGMDQDDEDDMLADAMEPSVPAPSNPESLKQAILVLRSRKSNEPLVRVREGRCTIRNIVLQHISNGNDIWSGNAAIHIQPSADDLDDAPLLVMPTPSVVLDRVEVTSASGRGIVNVDGGHLTIQKCYIHDCAATGIYIGGQGSQAVIEHTDVMKNGEGNIHHRRGIARGHSGVYLEQGRALIRDCSISRNALTGISAVSADSAILNLEESELVSNGTYQLEMPAIGTFAQSQSHMRSNVLAHTGKPRSRSGLVVEEEA